MRCADATADDPDFDRLAEALGDLPLALEQAAAYLEETATTSGDYLALLATHARRLFALGRPTTTEQTIATIWSVSLDRLRTQAPAAEALLHLCAFLAPDDIPRRLLEDHPDVLPEPLATAVRDRLGYQQAFAGVGRYSLATITNHTISVHRLVQAVVRHGLEPHTQQRWADVAVELIVAAFPSNPGDVDAWPVAATLLPHALTAGDHADRLGAKFDKTIVLFDRAAHYLWQRAEYIQATELLQRALTISERQAGANHLSTAQRLNNLALVLRDRGDLDHARTLHERALNIYETHLGPEHPLAVRSRENLAAVAVELENRQ